MSILKLRVRADWILQANLRNGYRLVGAIRNSSIYARLPRPMARLMGIMVVMGVRNLRFGLYRSGYGVGCWLRMDMHAWFC